MTSFGAAKYGMSPHQPLGADQSAAANGAVTSRHANVGSALNPENPFLWLFGVGAVTLGLIAVTTHVRVGKFSASASAGTP